MGEWIQPYAAVPLAALSTLGVGGPALWYFRARRVEQVQSAHEWAAERNLPVFVLGGGSNIVVSDGGFGGLVLHIAIDGAQVRASGDDAVIEVGAGEPWDPLVERLVDAEYAGMECLSGIPGLVGGTPIQNVGAYGQEVADNIASVTVFDARSYDVLTMSAAECGFSYRQSRFKQQDRGRFTVCSVCFRLRRGAPTLAYPDVVTWVEQRRLRQPRVNDIRRAVLEIRRSKGMVLDPGDPDTQSVGSFFMNPILPERRQAELGAPGFPLGPGQVKIPAAWLIERAGFSKGFAAGAAGLSTKHPLAIVNRGGARTSDILDLACRIKRAVLDRFGVALRPEPVFVGLQSDERVAFLQREHD